eukprot:1148992-Pelagomonas_calceolata.AAC.6
MGRGDEGEIKCTEHLLFQTGWDGFEEGLGHKDGMFWRAIKPQVRMCMTREQGQKTSAAHIWCTPVALQLLCSSSCSTIYLARIEATQKSIQDWAPPKPFLCAVAR